MFDTGDRVNTTLGPGRVVYRRMKPPNYSEVDAYSVKLDGKQHAGTILGAEKVWAENVEPGMHPTEGL